MDAEKLSVPLGLDHVVAILASPWNEVGIVAGRPNLTDLNDEFRLASLNLDSPISHLKCLVDLAVLSEILGVENRSGLRRAPIRWQVDVSEDESVEDLGHPRRDEARI